MGKILTNYAAHHTRAPGFTRIELLVVLAISTLAIFLIVPGIQNVRETARRCQCKDNLRRLGICIQAGAARVDDESPHVEAISPDAKDARDSELMLVIAVVFAAFATAGALSAALVVRVAVWYVNRRGRRLGRHDERNADSLLDRWFCPPSSALI